MHTATSREALLRSIFSQVDTSVGPQRESPRWYIELFICVWSWRTGPWVAGYYLNSPNRYPLWILAPCSQISLSRVSVVLSGLILTNYAMFDVNRLSWGGPGGPWLRWGWLPVIQGDTPGRRVGRTAGPCLGPLRHHRLPKPLAISNHAPGVDPVLTFTKEICTDRDHIDAKPHLSETGSTDDRLVIPREIYWL